MKTEKFDDAIKKKISDLEANASDAEVDSVHKHVQQNLGRKFFFQTAATAKIAAGLLITGLIGWNIYLSLDKKNTEKQLSKLEQQLKETQKEVSDLKQAPNDESNENINSALQPNSLQNTNATAIEKIYTPSSASNYNTTKKVKQKDNKNVTNEGYTNNLQNGKNASPSLEEPKENYQIAKEQTPEEIVDSNKSAQNELPEKIDSALEQKNIQKPKLPKNRASWAYQVGIGTEVAKGSNGQHMQANFVMNNRWDFGIGFQKLDIHPERFRNPHEFHDRKGKDFKNIYESKMPDTANIEDIRIENHVFQIPVSIAYHFHLKKGWGLLFAAGTNIDIKANQNIDYHHFGAPEKPDGFVTNVPVVAINNMMLSTGVEKRIKKFSLQAGPFINAIVKPVIYKNDKFVYGMRFRLLYNLGS